MISRKRIGALMQHWHGSMGDPRGRSYYGVGAPLFEVEDLATGKNYIRRATSAAEARMKVIAEERPDLSLRRR
jgi:hypothetical protein